MDQDNTGVGITLPKNDDETINKILSSKNYYDSLFLSKSCTKFAIKKHYHSLAKKFHPDVSKHPKSTKIFKKVVKSFQCLYNPDTRNYYDEFNVDLNDPIQVHNDYERQIEEEERRKREFFSKIFYQDFEAQFKRNLSAHKKKMFRKKKRVQEKKRRQRNKILTDSLGNRDTKKTKNNVYYTKKEDFVEDINEFINLIDDGIGRMKKKRKKKFKSKQKSRRREGNNYVFTTDYFSEEDEEGADSLQVINKKLKKVQKELYTMDRLRERQKKLGIGSFRKKKKQNFRINAKVAEELGLIHHKKSIVVRDKKKNANYSFIFVKRNLGKKEKKGMEKESPIFVPAPPPKEKKEEFFEEEKREESVVRITEDDEIFVNEVQIGVEKKKKEEEKKKTMVLEERLSERRKREDELKEEEKKQYQDHLDRKKLEAEIREKLRNEMKEEMKRKEELRRKEEIRKKKEEEQKEKEKMEYYRKYAMKKKQKEDKEKETKVIFLMEMNYERDLAMNALEKNAYNLDKALIYLKEALDTEKNRLRKVEKDKKVEFLMDMGFGRKESIGTLKKNSFDLGISVELLQKKFKKVKPKKKKKKKNKKQKNREAQEKYNSFQSRVRTNENAGIPLPVTTPRGSRQVVGGEREFGKQEERRKNRLVQVLYNLNFNLDRSCEVLKMHNFDLQKSFEYLISDSMKRFEESRKEENLIRQFFS